LRHWLSPLSQAPIYGNGFLSLYLLGLHVPSHGLVSQRDQGRRITQMSDLLLSYLTQALGYSERMLCW
jgi:hypothetical protein